MLALHGSTMRRYPMAAQTPNQAYFLTEPTELMMDSRYHYDPALTPFDSHIRGYHPRNALWLAAAGNLAYEAEETIRATVREWGFTRFAFLHASATMDTAGVPVPVDTQAFVCSTRDTTLIAFRGTEPLNVRDWVTDLMIATVYAPVGVGKIHRGFDAAFAAISPQLELALNEQHDGHSPIWITGHSLGGALSVLAAVQLSFAQQLPVQGVYTFGQPRVGDRTFAKFLRKALQDRVVRFVNDRDIVPQVPSPGMLINYRHHVPETHFDPEGNLVLKRSLADRTRSLLKGSPRKIAQLGIEGFTDHSMDRYIEHIRRLAGPSS